MMRRTALTAVALIVALGLAGCGGFDPLDKLQDWDIMGAGKKPLPGERRAVFPEGTPGVPQGVPPELVKGYQAPPEEPPPPPPVAEKPKPRKVAARPKKAAPPPPPPQQQTTTQPAPATAGRTIPGAQPTWPQQAPPPPQQQGWPAPPPPPQQQAWPAPPPPPQQAWPTPQKQ